MCQALALKSDNAHSRPVSNANYGVEPFGNVTKNGIGRAVLRSASALDHEVLKAVRGVAPTCGAHNNRRLKCESVGREDREPVTAVVSLERLDTTGPRSGDEAYRSVDSGDSGRGRRRQVRSLRFRRLLQPLGQA